MALLNWASTSKSKQFVTPFYTICAQLKLTFDVIARKNKLNIQQEGRGWLKGAAKQLLVRRFTVRSSRLNIIRWPLRNTAHISVERSRVSGCASKIASDTKNLTCTKGGGGGDKQTRINVRSARAQPFRKTLCNALLCKFTAKFAHHNAGARVRRRGREEERGGEKEVSSRGSIKKRTGWLCLLFTLTSQVLGWGDHAAVFNDRLKLTEWHRALASAYA